MQLPHRIAFLIPLLLLTCLGIARGNLAADYLFTYGTGSSFDMSGATQLVAGGNDDVWSSAQSIGFEFYLDGEPFTYFFAGTNGPMMLSTSTAQTFTYIYAYESFNSVNCPHPVITAFFDDMVASGNGVRTILVGTAPNRIRVVDWEGYLWYGSGTDTEFHFQVRLYEGSNKIELWYGQMGSNDVTNGNGQIGAALTTTNFISVIAGNPPQTSPDITINDLSRTPISPNTLYTLRPCQKNFTIAGDPSQGGTIAMSDGDVILDGIRTRVGSAANTQPFTISMGEFPCGESRYTYALGGEAAEDYSITPSQGEIGSFQSLTPVLTFSPGDTGVREATLRITDGKGFDRTYTLRGIGFRCVEWVGDPSQGGSVAMENGDTLLGSYQVPIGFSESYTPIRINQVSTDEGCTDPVLVTYTIDDPTGNYSVSPLSEMIPVGGASVPTITFNAANGVGYQEATLTVNADGEIRTFLLRDFVAAPGGEIRYGGTAIGPNTALFRDQFACVGDQVISLRLEAVNIGAGDFVIRGLEGFLFDTTMRQGVPPYPILTDAFGQPVSTEDYFLSTTPGTVPRTPEDEFDSIVVPEREMRELYLNLIPSRLGKRYARIYISTNAFNLKQPDISGDTVHGLTYADVFARGLGGRLANGPNGDRPHPVVFDATKVRESRTMTASIYNSGDCDLRIDEERLRFEAGDVAEFQLLSLSGGTQVGKSYVLTPGQSLTATVQFTPSRSGSRWATMRLVTNDSSLIIPAITERGVYQWEFFGVGKHDLEARDLSLPPAVIGAESSAGVVRIENTQLDQITVDSIVIVGASTEIIQDPGKPWPSVPLKINAGEQIDLAILFVPTADSDPGVREAEILLFLSNGDTARAKITGYAGTRELTVAPLELFTGKQVPVGGQARAIFTVTNTGTLPTTLDRIVITGPDEMFYSVSPLHRRVMEPGQTEFIQVTYTPGTQAPHSAMAEVRSNAVNGTQIVQLGGEGTSTIPVNGQDNATETALEGSPLERNDANRADASTLGLRLAGISPNPTTGRINIAYTLPTEGSVTCELYSADGRLMRTLHRGTVRAGGHELHADLRDLPEGIYFVQILSGEKSIVTRVSLIR